MMSVLREASGLAVCRARAISTAAPNWASSLGVVGTHAAKATAEAVARATGSQVGIFIIDIVLMLPVSSFHLSFHLKSAGITRSGHRRNLGLKPLGLKSVGLKSRCRLCFCRLLFR